MWLWNNYVKYYKFILKSYIIHIHGDFQTITIHSHLRFRTSAQVIIYYERSDHSGQPYKKASSKSHSVTSSRFEADAAQRRSPLMPRDSRQTFSWH